MTFLRQVGNQRGASQIEYCAVAACLMLGLLTALHHSRDKLGVTFLRAAVGVSLGEADTGELESFYAFGGSTEGTRLMFPQSSHGGGGGSGCGKTQCNQAD